MTSSNQLSLSETPPGGLFATTNTSVIAALKSRSPNDLLEQGCTAAKFSPFVLQKNSAFAGPFKNYLPPSTFCSPIHCTAQSQAEEAGLGSHWAGGVTQNILAGSPPRTRDMALSNRCDSSCQGFGPHHHHHHHHSTSTLWVTRTLHLFSLIKIKGSHSHVQAVLMIGQYGNKVIERWGYSSSHRH